MFRPLSGIALCVALVACLLTPSLAQAQVTRIVVPYPAGQLSDIIGRTVREALVRQGAGSAMVENIPGAGGAIGAQQFLNAAGGSYPLLLGSPNELILAPLSNAAVKYRAEDFRLVALVGTGPMVLVTRAELGASNADELIEAARRSSKSEPLSYGSVGVGSLYHLILENVKSLTGTKLEGDILKHDSSCIGSSHADRAEQEGGMGIRSSRYHTASPV